MEWVTCAPDGGIYREKHSSFVGCPYSFRFDDRKAEMEAGRDVVIRLNDDAASPVCDHEL